MTHDNEARKIGRKVLNVPLPLLLRVQLPQILGEEASEGANYYL